MPCGYSSLTNRDITKGFIWEGWTFYKKVSMIMQLKSWFIFLYTGPCSFVVVRKVLKVTAKLSNPKLKKIFHQKELISVILNGYITFTKVTVIETREFFLRMAGHTRDQCYLEVPASSNKNTIVFYLYKQTNKQINKPEVKLNSMILLSSPQSTNSLNLNCKMDWTISSNNQF